VVGPSPTITRTARGQLRAILANARMARPRFFSRRCRARQPITSASGPRPRTRRSPSHQTDPGSRKASSSRKGGYGNARRRGDRPLLASLAVAAPWIQSLGRLRCLVQGCCHGGPTCAAVGIGYRHGRSRVTRLSDLAGRPIHATPLYSIAGNVIIGLLLIRLRILGAPDPLLLGGYLMAGGIAWFVGDPIGPSLRSPGAGFASTSGSRSVHSWPGCSAHCSRPKGDRPASRR
jgi:hypothetical protein